MERIIQTLLTCNTCKAVSSNLPVRGCLLVLTQRSICTTIPLQRKKQSRKYRPRVPKMYLYGSTHRLVRGLDVSLDRYGPLVDKPDYTYLDGRPTPLSPKQVKERQERKEMAARTMQQLREIDTVKQYVIEKAEKVEAERQHIISRKLKPKS